MSCFGKFLLFSYRFRKHYSWIFKYEISSQLYIYAFPVHFFFHIRTKEERWLLSKKDLKWRENFSWISFVLVWFNGEGAKLQKRDSMSSTFKRELKNLCCFNTWSDWACSLRTYLSYFSSSLCRFHFHHVRGEPHLSSPHVRGCTSRSSKEWASEG